MAKIVTLAVLSLFGCVAHAQDQSLDALLSSATNKDLAGVVSNLPEPYVSSADEFDDGGSLTAPEQHSERLNINIKIPHSRSLQAAKSSIATPRQVVSIPADKIGDPPSYLGFIKGAEEGEALLWNKNTEKYDFKFVRKSLAGNQYQFESPPAGLCLRCHQGEGPIFPVANWSESQASDANAKALGLNQHDAFNEAGHFDQSVRKANEILQSKKVCESLCKRDDKKCKIKLLKLELQIYSHKDVERSGEIENWIKKSTAKKDFSYVSSTLPDREVDPQDPTKSKTTIFYWPPKGEEGRKFDCNSGDISELSRKNAFPSYEDAQSFFPDFGPGQTLPLTMICLGTNPSEPSSPLFKRPKVAALNADSINSGLSRIVKACFGMDKEILEILDNQEWSKSLQRLNDSKCTSHLFDKGSVDNQVLGDIINGNKISKCESNTLKNMSNAIVSCKKPSALSSLQSIVDETTNKLNRGPPSEEDRAKAMQLFQTSCLTCHGNDIPLDINWKNLDSIENYRTSSGLRVIDRIRSGEMPADKSLNADQTNLLLKVLSFDASRNTQ